ncbi:hypothetical protein ATCC90586_006050 [Pythium insidiosum]|nr:hypothetical protein ATCC90586_006050 [Pythium insidiosum]
MAAVVTSSAATRVPLPSAVSSAHQLSLDARHLCIVTGDGDVHCCPSASASASASAPQWTRYNLGDPADLLAVSREYVFFTWNSSVPDLFVRPLADPATANRWRRLDVPSVSLSLLPVTRAATNDSHVCVLSDEAYCGAWAFVDDRATARWTIRLGPGFRDIGLTRDAIVGLRSNGSLWTSSGQKYPPPTDALRALRSDGRFLCGIMMETQGVACVEATSARWNRLGLESQRFSLTRV